MTTDHAAGTAVGEELAAATPPSTAAARAVPLKSITSALTTLMRAILRIRGGAQGTWNDASTYGNTMRTTQGRYDVSIGVASVTRLALR